MNQQQLRDEIVSANELIKIKRLLDCDEQLHVAREIDFALLYIQLRGEWEALDLEIK